LKTAITTVESLGNERPSAVAARTSLQNCQSSVYDVLTEEFVNPEKVARCDPGSNNLPTSRSCCEKTNESAKGLVYPAGDLIVTVGKERGRWRIVVARGDRVLGADLVNPAEAKERRRLVRNLQDTSVDDVKALEALLLQLVASAERDWAEHEQRVAERQQRHGREQAEREAAEAAEGRDRRLEQMESMARPVLADPALLYRVGEDMGKRGLVGERANGLLLYLAVLSQITKEPISAVVKGDSSGGKSHLVKTVLEIVPEMAHIDLTSMSERALIYDDRDYAHRTVVIFEAEGQASDLGTYLLRTLISEGQIRHLTVESTESGQAAREIIKQGPTNFITTTTMPELHPENETRVWTVLVDDSATMTRQVLTLQAERASGVFEQQDVEDVRMAFAWLQAAGVKEAVVPYAERLAEMMPARPLRLRRDFPRLLQLIKTCALLHQLQRTRDGQGRVVADLADYAMVRELVAPIFLRAVRGLTEKTTELVEALQEVLGSQAEKGGEAKAAYSDLMAVTGKPKHHISRWLRPALELGLVENEHAGDRGKPAALKLGRYQVEEGGVLPSTERLAQELNVAIRWVSPIGGQKRCCSVAQRPATA
jgi:hypothetical protein